ncbi:MAG: general secretion pathway protein GspC [Labilithrix sp.]|nr:general secretion pathway protein GspC [Labilithrix sp.]MBX3219410.1 general secretion pathway protein GspC [Labilithrix sp.]
MPLDFSIRKNFWLVPLPLVAAAALLNAQAVTQLVGTVLGPDEKQLAQAPPGSARFVAPGVAAQVRSARPILERNPFDHVTGSLLPKNGEASEDGHDAPAAVDTNDPWNAPACEGINVTAVAASGDEDWSFASLAGSDQKPRLLRRGGQIDGKTVHFVGRDRVWLSGNGALCQAHLFDTKQPPPPPPPPPAAETPSTRSRVGALDPDLRKGIQAVSATEFNIDRGVVDKILENQADLMRQARVVPVQENGRVVGVRLNGIRPDALLGVLGMQNGDQLRTINGFEMGSPEKALEAYARLRTADKLTIQLNRNGKNVNIDYNIK